MTMSAWNDDPEQDEADRLEAWLAAWQGGAPADPTPDNDALLATQLVRLADELQPDPAFARRLELRLLQQARQQHATQPPPVSVWERISRRPVFDLKPLVYSLAGVAVLAVVILAAWSLLRPGDDAPGVVVEAPSATPEAIAQVETMTPITPPDADDALTAAAPAAEDRAAESALVPAGPPRGLGGGGGADVAYAPFLSATLTLAAPLPTDSVGPVVVARPRTLSLDDFRAIADRLGATGAIYFEWYTGSPVAYDASAPGNYVYRIFQGEVRVSMFNSTDIYYENLAYLNTLTQPPLPFEQRRAIAESFLQERGLLTFSYVTRPGWGYDVQFLLLQDGRPVTNYPFITVTVTPAGHISSISYRPLTAAQQVEEVPLITAAAAWAYLQAHLPSGQVVYNIYPTHPTSNTPQPTPGVTHWERPFAAGQNVVIYSWLQIYRPIYGQGAPLLVTDRNLILEGDPGLLEEIANNAGQIVRLEGQIVGEPGQLRLQVAAWSPQTEPYDLYLTGTTRSQAGAIYLEIAGGFRILLLDAPADLPVDAQVSVYSWGVRAENSEQCQAVMDWVTLDLLSPVYDSEPVPAVDDPYTGIEAVTITQVELALQYTYPGEAPYPAGRPYSQDDQAHALPTWLFRGVTNKGDEIEFAIPAVAALELP